MFNPSDFYGDATDAPAPDNRVTSFLTQLASGTGRPANGDARVPLAVQSDNVAPSASAFADDANSNSAASLMQLRHHQLLQQRQEEQQQQHLHQIQSVLQHIQMLQQRSQQPAPHQLLAQLQAEQLQQQLQYLKRQQEIEILRNALLNGNLPVATALPVSMPAVSPTFPPTADLSCSRPQSSFLFPRQNAQGGRPCQVPNSSQLIALDSGGETRDDPSTPQGGREGPSSTRPTLSNSLQRGTGDTVVCDSETPSHVATVVGGGDHEALGTNSSVTGTVNAIDLPLLDAPVSLQVTLKSGICFPDIDTSADLEAGNSTAGGLSSGSDSASSIEASVCVVANTSEAAQPVYGATDNVGICKQELSYSSLTLPESSCDVNEGATVGPNASCPSIPHVAYSATVHPCDPRAGECPAVAIKSENSCGVLSPRLSAPLNLVETLRLSVFQQHEELRRSTTPDSSKRTSSPMLPSMVPTSPVTAIPAHVTQFSPDRQSYMSAIDCGKTDANGTFPLFLFCDLTHYWCAGVRSLTEYSSFFGKEVEVFTAVQDPHPGMYYFVAEYRVPLPSCSVPEYID